MFGSKQVNEKEDQKEEDGEDHFQPFTLQWRRFEWLGSGLDNRMEQTMVGSNVLCVPNGVVRGNKSFQKNPIQLSKEKTVMGFAPSKSIV